MKLKRIVSSVALVAAGALLAACGQAISSTSQAEEQPPVVKLRALYQVNGIYVGEFSLTDGTPCTITFYRNIVNCGWDRSGWRN